MIDDVIGSCDVAADLEFQFGRRFATQNFIPSPFNIMSQQTLTPQSLNPVPRITADAVYALRHILLQLYPPTSLTATAKP